MLTEETAQRIERKLDMILDAMGLTHNHRFTPIEVNETARAIVAKFRQKQQKQGAQLKRPKRKHNR